MVYYNVRNLLTILMHFLTKEYCPLDIDPNSNTIAATVSPFVEAAETSMLRFSNTMNQNKTMENMTATMKERAIAGFVNICKKQSRSCAGRTVYY